jgi:hypothetical protein
MDSQQEIVSLNLVVCGKLNISLCLQKKLAHYKILCGFMSPLLKGMEIFIPLLLLFLYSSDIYRMQLLPVTFPPYLLNFNKGSYSQPHDKHLLTSAPSMQVA